MVKPLLFLRFLLAALDATSWSGAGYEHIVSCVEFNLILATISGADLSVSLKHLRFALENAVYLPGAPEWTLDAARHVGTEVRLQARLSRQRRRRGWVKKMLRL